MKNHYYDQLYQDGSYVSNPDYIEGCERSWLIQRLKRPTKMDNPWGFGGGLRHGGLSDGAWEIFRKLCSFDYMGAAEFEIGALPKAFEKMWSSRSGLEAYSLTVSGNPDFPWSDKMRLLPWKTRERISKRHTLNATVFAISLSRYRPHADEVIKALAEGIETRERYFLKEASLIEKALFSDPKWFDDKDYSLQNMCVGWLEFDNGFMFFSDEGMWRNFCELFGVKIPDSKELNIVSPDFSEVNKELVKELKKQQKKTSKAA